jgi:S-formylglutathione hydrolase FrmB
LRGQGRQSRAVILRRRLIAIGALGAAVLAVMLVVRSFGVDRRGARVTHFAIKSSFAHRTLAVATVTPAGNSPKPRPLLVFLHGKGGNENSSVDGTLFAALARLGPRAPDIVFPDGGADSYWHDRSGAAWASYVMREVIPQAIARLHADPARLAIGGISMGGFGAVDIARLHPGTFCAVGGHSAALWLTGADSAAGAFDDAQDFARHDVTGSARRSSNPYPGAALWLDVGTQDPFRSAGTALAAAVRAHGHAIQMHVWPGGHEQSYSQTHLASYLAFYAKALARCRR